LFGFIEVVSVLLERGIVWLASEKVALLSGDDLTTAVSTRPQGSQSECLDAASEYTNQEFKTCLRTSGIHESGYQDNTI
jgi:hypothetical protein